MNDNLVNRLSMFQASIRTLDKYKDVWFEKTPRIFTAKLEAAVVAVSELELLGQRQEEDTRGATEAKQRAESDLEEAAYVLGGTLAIWFYDQQHEEQAAKVALTQSEWRRLRSQQLLEKARLVLRLSQEVVAGHDAEQAAEYGISAETLGSYEKAVEEYHRLVTASDQSIAGRKALTAELPRRFNEVADQFEVLDQLILQFGVTAEGRDLVSAYQAARVIRDRGRRPSAEVGGNQERRELSSSI